MEDGQEHIRHVHDIIFSIQHMVIGTSMVGFNGFIYYVNGVVMFENQ